MKLKKVSQKSRKGNNPSISDIETKQDVATVYRCLIVKISSKLKPAQTLFHVDRENKSFT